MGRGGSVVAYRAHHVRHDNRREGLDLQGRGFCFSSRIGGGGGGRKGGAWGGEATAGARVSEATTHDGRDSRGRRLMAVSAVLLCAPATLQARLSSSQSPSSPQWITSMICIERSYRANQHELPHRHDLRQPRWSAAIRANAAAAPASAATSRARKRRAAIRVAAAASVRVQLSGRPHTERRAAMSRAGRDPCRRRNVLRVFELDRRKQHVHAAAPCHDCGLSGN